LGIVGLSVGLLATSGGCFLVPATGLNGDGGNNGATNGADNGATDGTNGGSTDGGQNSANGTNGLAGPRGEIGPAGLNCWDLNGNGRADADEDANGDGAFDAADCQGAAGLRGPAGATGAAGADGGDGVDGTDGADGIDLTGVLARGMIPLDGNFGAAAGGINSAERNSTGEYTVVISLDDFPTAQLPATADELAVVLTIEKQNVGGGSGVLALLFAYYEITSITPDTATIRVSIRDLTTAAKDANFSIVVLAP
jgi:hypothetical protein